MWIDPNALAKRILKNVIITIAAGVATAVIVWMLWRGSR